MAGAAHIFWLDLLFLYRKLLFIDQSALYLEFFKWDVWKDYIPGELEETFFERWQQPAALQYACRRRVLHFAKPNFTTRTQSQCCHCHSRYILFFYFAKLDARLTSYVFTCRSPLSPPLDDANFHSARNTDLKGVVTSMKQMEDRFNKKFGYDYVFLNDQPFEEKFKQWVFYLYLGSWVGLLTYY